MALSPSRWIASSSTINKVLPASGTERPSQVCMNLGINSALIVLAGKDRSERRREEQAYDWLNVPISAKRLPWLPGTWRADGAHRGHGIGPTSNILPSASE